ncbi:MAG: hypothetical protein WC554_02995 [Clostridia bacterium]
MVEIKLSEKDEKAKQLVKDRFNTARDYRRLNYDQSWLRYQKQYRSRLASEKEYKFQARLFIPYSFSSVETVIPRVMEAIFSYDPIVAVKPRSAEDIVNSSLIEKLLNYQINRMDFINSFHLLTKMCLIYGTCIAKVDWKKEYRKVKRFRAKIDEFGNPVYDDKGKPVIEKVEQEILYYDDPYIYPIDIFNFYIDPKATSIDTAEYCIMVTETTMDRLRQMQKMGIYKNVNMVEEIKGTIRHDDGRERFINVDKHDPNNSIDKHSQKVTLYEHWEDDRVIVLAEEQVVIRDEENPYWHCRKPFVSGIICPVEHQFYGIGLMEMVESLQNELNDLRNLRMDNLKLAINCMYKIARDADVDIDNLINEPGGVIQTNYVDGIEALETKDVTTNAFTEAKIITDDIQTTHGIYDYSKGRPSQDRETATGILSLQEAANYRFKLMILLLCKNILGRGSEFMVDLNEQFINTDKIFKLTGEQYTVTQYDVEDIIGRFDFEPVGASLEGLSKYARLEQLLRYRQIFAGNPEFNQTAFDKELMKLLHFLNPDQFFRQMIPQNMMGQMSGQNPMQSMLNQSGQMSGQTNGQMQGQMNLPVAQ